jgi:UDP-glucose 4-epimerase
MKILITGVAGFIGSNLAMKLIEAGEEVIGIDNLSHGYMRNLDSIIKNPKFTFILGDIANPLLLKDVHSDVIVHLASQKSPRYTTSLRTLEENYLMLRNIIYKCLMNKSKLVFASTSDVYGKNTKIPFHEESDLILGSTKIKRWAYASSKLVGEQLIVANNEEYGMEYTIMRFFGSYGPNQNTTWWGGPQSVFMDQILNNEEVTIHGDGSQTRSFTYVDDLISGIIKSSETKEAEGEIINLGSDEEISILALAELIAKIIDGSRQPKIRLIPYESFGGGYEDVRRRIPDLEKAGRILGYRWLMNLADGLEKTIRWHKDNPLPRR